ncbi:MAG: hypothetical protein E7671_03645 [Ruminococcaceae bacterium]|nr:hypothetical protein [Oscillospiraceae bacterium]
MKTQKMNYIKAACFLVAFAAVGAGFAFRSHVLQTRLNNERLSAEEIVLSDCAKNLERLRESLTKLESSPPDKRASVLSDVKLYSELASISLGNIDFKSVNGEELFAFLKTARVLSENALEMGISEEGSESSTERAFTEEKAPPLSLFTTLSGYASGIVKSALPYLEENTHAFEEKLSDIFSDTSLETMLYENGYGTLVPTSGFKTIGGGSIKESEALSVARKHLGKKAYLKATLSGVEFPSYQLTGENISALVSSESGILMQFLFDLPERETKIDGDTARGKADAFLEGLGFDPSSLSVSALPLSGNLYVFEYIPASKSGVLCLDEKIRVGVSCGSGRICLYDAVDYYKYHTKTLVLPEKMIGADEISARYSPSPAPVLCKIERADGIESLCYRLDSSGTEIFINALSGAEIKP